MLTAKQMIATIESKIHHEETEKEQWKLLLAQATESGNQQGASRYRENIGSCTMRIVLLQHLLMIFRGGWTSK